MKSIFFVECDGKQVPTMNYLHGKLAMKDWEIRRAKAWARVAVCIGLFDLALLISFVAVVFTG